MYTAPHFLYAPQAVADSVIGMDPNPDLHTPIVWDIEPVFNLIINLTNSVVCQTSGTTLEVNFRLQVAIPMYRDKIAM